jgi:PST family polysaccharide transporter
VSLGDVAAKGAGVTLVVQVGQTVVQLASVIALTRLLTPTDFGLVGMVTAIVGIAAVLQDFGLSMAAIRAPTVSRAEQTNLFWANTALGVLCCGIVAASTPLVVSAYREPRLAPIVPVLALVFIASGMGAQYSAMLAREFRFKELGIVNISAQILSVVAAVAMAAADLGFWSIVGQQICYAVSVTAGYVWCTKWLPGLPVRGVTIRPFLRFGSGVLGTQAIAYATKNVDNIAIGAVWGAVPLGLYSRAYQLMLAPLNKINAPMTRVALPVLSRVQTDDEKFLRYLSRAQVISCYVTATVFALIAGLAQPVVDLLFGTEWRAAAPLVAILAIGGIFRSVAQVAYWAYLARGASGKLFRQRLLTGAITVALILAGVPWGALGVAVACAAAALASWLIAMIHVASAAHIDSRYLLMHATRIIVCVALPTGAGAWGSSLLPAPAAVQVIAGLAIACAYFAVACALIPWIRADVAFSWTFVRRSIGRGGRATLRAQP